MPYEYHVDRQRRVVEIRLVGPVTVEDILEGFDSRTRAPDYEPGMDLLLDCTDARVDVDRVGVDRVLRHFESRRELRGRDFRVALASPSDLNFATARMYELLSGLAEQYPEQTRVFRDRDEARRWLEEVDPVQVGSAD